MPIVDKINALTGKSAETIEDAIANIDIGGGGSDPESVYLGTGQHGYGYKINDTKSEYILRCETTFQRDGVWNSLYDLIGERKIVDVYATLEDDTRLKGIFNVFTNNNQGKFASIFEATVEQRKNIYACLIYAIVFNSSSDPVPYDENYGCKLKVYAVVE